MFRHKIIRKITTNTSRPACPEYVIKLLLKGKTRVRYYLGMQVCVTQPKDTVLTNAAKLALTSSCDISLIGHHFIYLCAEQYCFLEGQKFCSRWQLGGKCERCSQGECRATTVFS